MVVILSFKKQRYTEYCRGFGSTKIYVLFFKRDKRKS